MHVFVAGAAGAIGRRLVPQLVQRGHTVTASTRDRSKFEQLRKLGAEPVVLDGLDQLAVRRALTEVKPDVIVHQMTALAGKTNLRRFDKYFAITNKLRIAGTEHLLEAAEVAGVGKFVAQSYTGWCNARTGPWIKAESDPLDPDPAEQQRESMTAIKFLDHTVPAAPMEGIVLRYGNFYGPGASEEMVKLIRKRQLPVIGDGAGVWSWIHLDDAAAATVAAVECGERGIYNITDDDPAPVSEWLPFLAKALGAKPPLRVPVWVGRVAGGEVTVRWMSQGRGSSNAKAKRELGWRPTWSTWRDGFRRGLTDPVGPVSSAPRSATTGNAE